MLTRAHNERDATTLSTLRATMSAPDPPAPAGGSKRKREKINIACTSCRQSKVKCEDARPCSRCISHGWRDSCVSWHHIKQRRRQKSEAVQADLQTLPAQSLWTAAGAEEVADLPPPERRGGLLQTDPPSLPPSGSAQSCQRQRSGAVRVAVWRPTQSLLGDVPPAPSLPPSVAAQSLSHGLPHRGFEAQTAPAEVWPSPTPAALSAVVGEGRGAAPQRRRMNLVVGEGSCAGKDAADGDERVASRCLSPSVDSDYVAPSNADGELSDAENDDVWRSVEHLKDVPITWDKL